MMPGHRRSPGDANMMAFGLLPLVGHPSSIFWRDFNSTPNCESGNVVEVRAVVQEDTVPPRVKGDIVISAGFGLIYCRQPITLRR